jgi:hypothetical protein
MSGENVGGHLMRAGLVHDLMSFEEADFYVAIDASGGWPLGYRYVGFEHTETRAAGFTNSPHNSGYWTVVADADDYYLWKLSPAALQRIADAVVSSIRLPKVNARALLLRNSRGYPATLAKDQAA